MSPALTVEVAPDLSEVAPGAWDALVGDDDPFVEHAFLAWLEASGSVGPGTGWTPAHLLVRDASGALVGAAPLYVKGHSYGEFIFDWGWADAARRAGLAYYPKLVSMVPLTPATGRRLLVHPDLARAPVVEALVEGARRLAGDIGASGIHWLFCTEAEQAELAEAGFRPRLSHQFHWTRRPGWTDYDAFLADLTSHRRKEVRRERRQATSTGLALGVEPLGSLGGEELAVLAGCYERTIADHGGIAYLRPAWFEGLAGALGHRGLVATARRDGRLVAASLAFHKGRHLYGRYWGTLDPAPALHFELCYHQLLDWGLSHGIDRFEAGAQGHHKLQRGLLPSLTYSAHSLVHPGLDRAVGDFLVREARQVRAEIAALSEGSPFRRAAEVAP